LVVASALAAIFALASSVSAHAADLRPMTVGVLPRLPAGSQALGSLPQSAPIGATVILQPRDASALTAYAQAVSTPSSSRYHHYLTVAQFAVRVAPNAAQAQTVRASLSARGLQIGTVAANGLSFAVTAPAATAASAFSTSFERYRLAGGGTGFANTVAPSLEANIAGLVQGVAGLNTLAVPRPIGFRPTATGASAPVRAASAATATAGEPKQCRRRERPGEPRRRPDS
jgi:subtilase family serine protease